MKYLVISIFILAFASCKKEKTNTTYTIYEVNSSKVHGTLETRRMGDKTIVHFKILSDTVARQYDAHFHQGPPNGYRGYAPYTFMNFGADGTLAEYSDTIDIKYTDFLDFDGTVVLHPMGQSTVLAKGGVGKNI